MKWTIMGVLGATALAWVVWYLKPPTDSVGSFLPGWADPARRYRMIRAQGDQDYDMFH